MVEKTPDILSPHRLLDGSVLEKIRKTKLYILLEKKTIVNGITFIEQMLAQLGVSITVLLSLIAKNNFLRHVQIVILYKVSVNQFILIKM